MAGSIELIVQTLAKQNRPIDADVRVSGATPGGQVTITLMQARSGHAALEHKQQKRANFSGVAVATFNLVFETAGAFVVTVSACEDGDVTFCSVSKSVEGRP